MCISANLAEIRLSESPTKIIADEPVAETWANRSYTEQDFDIDTRVLSNRKAHGNDRIPGEEYKATRQWAIMPITRIMNLIKNGRPIP